MTSTADGTRKVVQVGGHDVAYHDVGDGVPVVFLHGSGPGVTGWANFGNNVDHLPGIRSIVVDQPGFGASGRDEVYEDNYLNISANAVVGLMDALGLEQAGIVGNSMGGDVAVTVTLDHPERISRMLLNGPGGTGVPVLGPSPSEGIARLMDFYLDPTRERIVAWLKTMVFDQRILTEELIESRFAAATSPGAVKNLQDAYATFYNPALTGDVPLWGRVHNIRQPTIICWGRDDRVAPVEGGLLPARRMPKCDLRIYSRCGHWVQVERKKDFERACVEHFVV
ncbi:MAG: 4,5-9,10-diseco-3-hydroxy-5,9, 17-trioxoandrosta(10),2-diene-4-oate hydrolase [Frankiales bacterium]|nr:4,5-9,10-diseco-3-hydroxy-5,9, 17-trioxoandrosta(10),2-diene-4-oate hydrolase [Frankiales bacterium]